MPRKFTAYEPDAVDCNTMAHAISNDFGLIPEVTTTYAHDKVQIVVRCRTPAVEGAGVVQVQALVAAPLKTAKSLYIYQYSALLDCWHQCDRGVLGAAQRPIERDWRGRPIVPAKREG